MRPTMMPLDVVPEYPLDNDDDDGRAFLAILAAARKKKTLKEKERGSPREERVLSAVNKIHDFVSFGSCVYGFATTILKHVSPLPIHGRKIIHPIKR